MRKTLSLSLILALLQTSFYGVQNQQLPPAAQTTPAMNAAEPTKTSQSPAPAPISEKITLMKGTPVCLFPRQDVSSKTAWVNNRVAFHVGRDIAVDGVTVIAGGTEVWATVSEVQRPEIGGQDGRLSFAFEALRLVNGKTVPIQTFHLPRRTMIQPPKQKRPAGKAIAETLSDPYVIWWPVAVPFLALVPFQKGQEIALNNYQCVPEEIAEDVVLNKEEVAWSKPSAFAQQSKPQIHEEVIAEVHGYIVRAWTESRILSAIAPATNILPSRPLTASLTDHVFWIEERPGHKQTLWLDGKQLGGEYDEVRDVVSSKDFHQVAFTTRRGSRWVLMINGQESTPEFQDMLSPDITIDGKFVVSVRKDGKWRVLDNGQTTGQEFERSTWCHVNAVSEATFDDSGAHYAFIAHRRGKWITVMDGKETGVEMDDVVLGYAGPAIHTGRSGWAGQHFVVAAKTGGVWNWVVDGQPGPPFDAIGEIASTPDGGHFAYGGATFEPGKTLASIVLDGRIIATEPMASKEKVQKRKNFFGGGYSFEPWLHAVSDPKMLDDGTPVYVLRHGEKDLVVVQNGVPGPSFEYITDFSVTEDGKHVSYIGSRGASHIAMRDQTAGPTFATQDSARWIQISKDGSHVAYESDIFEVGKSLGLTASARIIVDGSADPEFQTLNLGNPSRVRGFQFSEDGKHYFYVLSTFSRADASCKITVREHMSAIRLWMECNCTPTKTSFLGRDLLTTTLCSSFHARATAC